MHHALLPALLLVSCIPRLAASAPERTLLADPPRQLSDFQLTSHEGESVRLSQLRGAPVLLFFGFTHCPTVCPAALQQLRQLEQQHRAELGATRVVVISVDGERDTPQALLSWLTPISKNFIGLTGAPATVRAIASQFSAAFYKTPGKAASEYLVEHNSQIFLIDSGGKLRATFFNAPTLTIAQVTQSVARTSAAP
ncbi:MAG: SCO family protein [Steroidobacter sp.]